MQPRLQSVLSASLLALVLLFGTGLPLEAQSDILLRLRSGSPAGDRVRVDSAGGFVAMGNLGIGIIPAVGGGDRMMWYPFRGVFRAGSAGNSASTAWNDANLGFYSWAGGDASRARGNYSFAMGFQAVADAQSSVSLGNATIVAS
jgi:hypothetical protein